MPEKFILEIATSDFVTTAAAVAGGADRIELCANMDEGGTTPSVGHIRRCRSAFSIPIFPIIRPRGGDFLYNDDEFAIMLYDVQVCKELDCDGVVLGLLCADGSIDRSRTAQLIDAAYPLAVTFHRAFDRCSDPLAAMEQLIGIGCERILTSGQQQTAAEGIDLITQLQVESNERIIIMPGSGVRTGNIGAIAKQTGCTEFHSSLRSTRPSPMEYINPAFAGSNDSYQNNWIDPQEVRTLRASLQNIP